jgi:hypothetical protein
VIIETIRHEPIVYRVHDLIVEHPGRFYPVKKLCVLFYGKYTKSLDTEMRSIVTEIVNDRMMQKIIISTKHGYVSPTPEQAKLVEQYLSETKKAAKALFYRRASILYRIGHDQQLKSKIGENDSEIYEAFVREIVDELDQEYLETYDGKKHRNPVPIFESNQSGQFFLEV